MIKKACLYFQTLKHLKLSQILFRAKRRLISPPHLKKISAPNQIHPIRSYLRESTTSSQLTKPSTFTFLNITINTQGQWFPDNASQLWIYNLHYFDYLFELDTFDKKLTLIQNWIDSVPIGAKDSWHPYTISLRLCNWIWALSIHSDPLPDKIVRSIQQQVYFLSHDLEFDVLGNHLIENCKALIITGLFLKERSFISKGLTTLQKELTEQILEDGGHYERSPMYHIIVLGDLISIYDGLLQSNLKAPWLLKAIERMSDFLQQISDKNFFPLFNDSSADITYSPQTVLNYAKDNYEFNFSPKLSSLLKSSGIFYYKNYPIKLWFDCGNLGPDFLLAHAHNDSLNIELHLNNEPILVDSGIYDYESGQPLRWRPYFRSSKSHNVVTINNSEPNQLWGSFRVGKRGYTHIKDTTNTSCKAFHNSYKKLGIYLYRKVDIQDSLSINISDTIDVRKKRSPIIHFESNFHFHPMVTFISHNQTDTTHTLILKTQNQMIQLQLFCPKTILKITNSWYSPSFNIKHKRLNLKLIGTTNETMTLNTYIKVI